MPHLYLPSDHTDADLVLAAGIADAVSSADLYVTWTLDSGPGAPEVATVLREQRAVASRGPFAELMLAVVHGLRVLWRSIAGPTPSGSAPRPVSKDAEPATGEPSL